MSNGMNKLDEKLFKAVMELVENTIISKRVTKYGTHNFRNFSDTTDKIDKLVSIEDEVTNRDFWWRVVFEKVGFAKLVDFMTEYSKGIEVDVTECDCCGIQTQLKCDIEHEEKFKEIVVEYLFTYKKIYEKEGG